MLAVQNAINLIQLDFYGTPDVQAIVRSQAEVGRIDAQFIYEDETHWVGVTDDPTYAHHDHDLLSLEVLIQSQAWTSAARSIGTLIDLGVGTGQKLRRFASSVLSRGGRKAVTTIMIDVNPNMLHSATGLLAAMPADGHNINAAECRARFDQLPKLIRDERIANAMNPIALRRAYLLLGNTVANLPEEETLGMLSRVLRGNDLLILSLEFGSIGSNINPISLMLEKYQKSDAIRRIFAAPLKYLDGHISDLEIVSVHADRRFSLLSKTDTVMPRVFWEGREVITAHSNRYDWDQFIGLLASFGFELITYASADEAPFYRYLMLRKAEL